MYTDVITLFNRVSGSRGEPDTWLPTVINGVNINIDRAVLLSKYGPDCKDKAVLNIRYRSEGGRVMVAGKRWAKPMEWDQSADSLTFYPVKDFFWAGEWIDGEVSDADYGMEGFYGYMNRTKDNVFLISSFAQYRAIPHFEVMGK